MLKDYNQITNAISDSLTKLRFEAPEIMKGHSDLAAAATKDGALDKKTKELIALALAIVARCDGSVWIHTQTVIKLGVTKQELIGAAFPFFLALGFSNRLRLTFFGRFNRMHSHQSV